MSKTEQIKFHGVSIWSDHPDEIERSKALVSSFPPRLAKWINAVESNYAFYYVVVSDGCGKHIFKDVARWTKSFLKVAGSNGANVSWRNESVYIEETWPLIDRA